MPGWTRATVWSALAALLLTANPAKAAPPEFVWRDHFGQGQNSFAFGVAATSDSVYAAGDGNLGLPARSFVRKYDVDGHLQWTEGISDSAGNVQASDVAADSTGAYVLAFLGLTGGDTDGLIVKLGPDGTEQWRTRFGTTRSDIPSAIAVSSAGVFVSGYTRGAFPGQRRRGPTDAFVARFNHEGDLLWVRQFGTPGWDSANVVWAGARAVYAAGPTDGAMKTGGHVGGLDVWVRKFTIDGSRVWTRQFGSASNESAFGVCVGRLGVAVAGNTEGQMPGARRRLGGEDAFVILVSRDGEWIWTAQFGGPDNDGAYAIACGDTHLLAGGQTDGTIGRYENLGGSSDAILVGLSAEGSRTGWLQFGTSGQDSVRDAARSGDAYFVSGYAEGHFPEETTYNGESALVGRIAVR